MSNLTAPYVHTFPAQNVARIDLSDGIQREPVPILRDRDTVTGLRDHGATCFVAVHPRSKNEGAHASLIPNATVIQAAHYGDLGREAATHELSFGDLVVVEGHGVYRIVKGTHANGGNADWPKLVPITDRRYYVEYSGGPGYLNWTFRDSLNDGASADRESVDEALASLSITWRPRDLIEAELVCAFLNYQAAA